MGIAPSPTLLLDAKTKELKSQGVDVVNFAAGEPDFDTPEHIKEAAIKAIRDNFTRYTPAGGILELKEAVAAKFKKDNNLDYSPDEIVINCGGKHTLYNLAQVLFGPGDQVLVPAPYWVSYPAIVVLAGAEPVIVPASWENGFKITPEDLEKAVTPRTKGLIINSPSNPTGAVYSKAELEALAETAMRHGLIIISDDIYEKMLYGDEPFVNTASLSPEMKANTVIAHGVAKTYAMTGWRIGFMAAPKAVASAVTKLQGQSTSNPCSIAQKAALAALTGPQDDVVKMREAFRGRRDFLVKGFNEMEGVSCFTPGGAFYVFPNVSSFYGKSANGEKIVNSDDMAQYLLEEARIAAVPGSGFGEDACVRLSYAISMEDNRKGLERMAAALGNLE